MNYLEGLDKGENNIMYHFEYVKKMKEKAKLIRLLNLVQDAVRKKLHSNLILRTAIKEIW